MIYPSTIFLDTDAEGLVHLWVVWYDEFHMEQLSAMQSQGPYRKTVSYPREIIVNAEKGVARFTSGNKYWKKTSVEFPRINDHFMGKSVICFGLLV